MKSHKYNKSTRLLIAMKRSEIRRSIFVRPLIGKDFREYEKISNLEYELFLKECENTPRSCL